MVTGIEQHIFFHMFLPFVLWLLGVFACYGAISLTYNDNLQLGRYRYPRMWVIIAFCMLTSFAGIFAVIIHRIIGVKKYKD